MLTHMASSKIKNADGSTTIMFRPNLPDIADPCACGAESVVNVCDGDGRLHHHGRVHTISGGLEALCKNCANVENGKWAETRSKEPKL